MKTRLTSRPGSGEERRSAANAQGAAQLKGAAAMPDTRATSLAQLQHQQLASSSTQAAQLKARAEMMAGLGGAAPMQRVEDEELLQGKFVTAQRVEDDELVQGKFEPVQRMEEEELLQGKFATVQRVEDEELVQGKFEPVQRMEDEELLQGKFATVQRVEEEELLQGKFEPVQRMEDEDLLQGKFAAPSAQLEEKPNNTGMPNQLKSGIESLSGMSMNHVKVHYNSNKPAQLNAHAYAQGSDIHMAPGQEQHLPHEAWHVVQQMQGRVRPTMQMKDDVPVNDDAGLEREADVMGMRAAQLRIVDAATNGRPAQQMNVTQLRPFQTREGEFDTNAGWEILHQKVLVKLLRANDGDGMANLYVAVNEDLEASPEPDGELLLEQIEVAARAQIKELMQDKDINELSDLGVLLDDQIRFWLSIDYLKKPPENLVIGKIAEALSARNQLAKHIDEKPEIKSGLRVGVPSADGDHEFRSIAEIDNLTVVMRDGKWTPIEIVEAKAGKGDGKGTLITQLSDKLKALKLVNAKGAKLYDGLIDVTDEYDLSGLEGVVKSTATPADHADFKLDRGHIDRLYRTVVILRVVGFESLRVLGL